MEVEKYHLSLKKQLNSFFENDFDFSPYIENTLVRLQKCFGKIRNKYYHNEKLIDTNHSCQWMAFLYTLSNELYKNGIDSKICSQVYYLNKIMNSIDLYYEIEMPEFWLSDHPLGTILGRAKYGNFFSFIQGCTIGNNNGIYPVMGDFVAMYAHSSILGDCHIGNRVVLGANACVKDENIPDNCFVFGQSPNLVIKQKSAEEMEKYFSRIWEI